MKQVVVGLSGHIDHGKTALVKALTGVSTERYSEEVQRGMTIDIGFAFLTDSITLIDVPGHEKFVKNMMAGVSGIDVAILVVAADDGVMPQTREHFEILKLLDIKQGIVVINKVDLADESWLELVQLDVEELIAESFLENAPIITVSATNEVGIDELKKSIINICESVPDKDDPGMFRLPIDRVFSIKGFGTVVTGTVSSGSLHVGDKIEILPSGEIAKVRGLQSHTEKVNSVHMGDRAAINIQGVEVDQIQRGNQITTPHHFATSNQIGVKLNLLSSSDKPIIQNQRIRVHMGTNEVMARVALTDTNCLEPGESAPALLRLETPLITSLSDKFIIRLYSPVLTIGGGEVIEPLNTGKWTSIKQKINLLYNVLSDKRIQLLVELEDSHPLLREDAILRLGLSNNKINSIVENDDSLCWTKYKQSEWLMTTEQLSSLQKKVINALKDFHQKNPYQSGVKRNQVRQFLNSEDQLIDYLLENLSSQKLIKKVDDRWTLSDFKINLSSIELTIQQQLIEILNDEGFTSSHYVELSKKINQDSEQVKLILNISEKQGKLLRLEGNLMFTLSNFIALKKKVNEFFNSEELLTVPQFKELAGTSRKYAVPLLEYLDKLKITYRSGDGRKLVA